MNNIARRSFLRRMAAAPVAIGISGEELVKGVTGRYGSVLGLVGARGEGDDAAPSSASGGVTKFTSFKKFIDSTNTEQSIREDARTINGFDPDVLTLHLPLQTKVRMQRERNYNYLMKQKEDWFARAVKTNGFLGWYM